MRTLEAVALLAWPFSLAAADAPAPAPSPEASETNVSLGGAVNPPGVQGAAEAVRRRGLWRSSHPLLSETHAALGAAVTASPAFLRAGVWVEVAPVAPVVVRAGAEPGFYLGTFGALVPYASMQADFSREARRARSGEAEPGWGSRLYVSPTLRARAGRFRGLATLDLERWRAEGPGTIYYEPARDTLLPADGGTLVRGSAVVLYEHPWRRGPLGIGATWSRSQVRDVRGNRIERVGGLLRWATNRRRLRLPDPVFLLNVFRYSAHPFQEGEWAAQGGVGFTVRR